MERERERERERIESENREIQIQPFFSLTKTQSIVGYGLCVPRFVCVDLRKNKGFERKNWWWSIKSRRCVLGEREFKVFLLLLKI